MKTIIFTIFLSLLFQNLLAQNYWSLSGANISNTNLGNVGIGTSNPNVYFSSGSTKVLEILASRPVLKLTSNNQAWGSLSTMVFTNSFVNNTTHLGEFHLNYWYKDSNPIQSNLRFASPVNTDDILVLEATGNVGIGTASPYTWFGTNRLLEISGTRPTLKLNSVSSNADGIATIYFTNNNVNNSTKTGEFHMNYYYSFQNPSTSYLSFGYPGPGGSVLNVIANGNVGIGTTNPSNKFEVCGNIRAKELKIETGWCDNVFEPDYKLMTIKEKEAYVQEYKHLPSVTSGAEIEKEGLEVGKTAKQMIQELEEAHLYLFAQQDDIDALKTENASQKAEIDNLKAEIQAMKTDIAKLTHK